ncbi:hypothetical protein CBS470a_004403 [Colletotrichum nupharicola]|nr:hypothetical protein CBS470a_004403 [Colletotrichum nupharicola]
MVLSLLVSFGTAVGAHEGIKASMAKSRKEEHRSRKNNLIVHCPKSSQYSPYLEGRRVVLSGDRLYIDTGTAHDVPFGHPFEGYYIPYPDSRYAGLVTTITPEAPIMNWVFMDPLTYSFQFGVRAVADANLTGPWDCTRQDRRLTFCGWEGFCAVLEDSGVWGLYYDFDGDGMRKKFGQEGRVVIEIELIRSELRTPKPEPEPEPQPEQDVTATAEQKDESAQQKGENSTEPESFSPERVDAPSKPVQEFGVTLEEKMERMYVGKVEDEETYSVISEPLSTMSTPSTARDGMPKKRRKRRSKAKKYQSPSVENSEEEKGTAEV